MLEGKVTNPHYQSKRKLCSISEEQRDGFSTPLLAKVQIKKRRIVARQLVRRQNPLLKKSRPEGRLEAKFTEV